MNSSARSSILLQSAGKSPIKGSRNDGRRRCRRLLDGPGCGRSEARGTGEAGRPDRSDRVGTAGGPAKGRTRYLPTMNAKICARKDDVCSPPAQWRPVLQSPGAAWKSEKSSRRRDEVRVDPWRCTKIGFPVLIPKSGAVTVAELGHVRPIRACASTLVEGGKTEQPHAETWRRGARKIEIKNPHAQAAGSSEFRAVLCGGRDPDHAAGSA